MPSYCLQILRQRVALNAVRLWPAFSSPAGLFPTRPGRTLTSLRRPPPPTYGAACGAVAASRGARKLASKRTVMPDGTLHPLKGDVSPGSGAEKTSGVPVDDSGRVLLKCMTLPELEHWVEHDMGHKKFRAKQLWRWLYKSDRLAATFDEMTDLSKDFREMLNRTARIDVIALDKVHESADGTKKITFRLDGGGVIETVLIPTEGYRRSLTQGEIIDQVVQSKRFFEGENSKIGRVCNVVFMGEGEPAHNLDNVLRAVDIMLDTKGLDFSHNKVTVSTSGLVPEIKRFAEESKANLAVSLHATNDELRSWLMPINRKYPLGELMQTLRDVFPRNAARQQKVFFQYLMLKGVNDSLVDAKELLRLTAGVPCKINLIHFNSHDGTAFEACEEGTMFAFQDYLVKKGMTVTIRKSRGDDKMMACGQLGKLGTVQAPRMKVPDKYAHLIKARVA